jgi:exodeoxyribonuclease VII small subunit
MEKKELSFEEKMKKLEEIISQVENEDLSLEKNLALYQEGENLIKDLTKQLNAAKEVVKKFSDKNEEIKVDN